MNKSDKERQDILPAVAISHSEFSILHSVRPTWAAISLPALLHNYHAIKQHVGDDVEVMAMVKANAYGHGTTECALALERAGGVWFGVALVEEGITLRRAGITRPILCVGGMWHGQADDVIAHDLTPAVFRVDTIEELNARAQSAGRILNVHLKVDTGLGRLGIQMNDLTAFMQVLKQSSHLRLEGLWTHFAEADSSEATYTQQQIARYEEALDLVRAHGLAPKYHHLANSPGLQAHPSGWGNLVRAGAALYGLRRDVLSPAAAPLDVRPVMSLYSRIVLLKTVAAGASLGYGRTFITQRESRIATIAIGYGDGWSRAHSNNGQVIVCSGQGSALAPIVGRVSMDLTIVDVTDVPGASLGDEVILFGTRDELQITAEDVAERIGTISYEVVTSLLPRVPRVYEGVAK